MKRRGTVMRSYIGKPVYKGVRLGPVIVIKDMHAPVKREKADSSEAELKRLEKACDKTKNQLQKFPMDIQNTIVQLGDTLKNIELSRFMECIPE